MAAIDTSFEVFKQLLQESIDSNASLSSTLQASLKLMVDGMARADVVELGASNVESASGNVSVDVVNDAIVVTAGTPATPNRVEWQEVELSTPRRVVASVGAGSLGALVGNVGGSSLAAVATADVSMQYRLSATDTWKSLTRNTVLSDVLWIQFAADVANQTADAALPKLQVVLEMQ